MINYINNRASSEEKFIIAPHQINPIAIQKLQKDILGKSVLFSNYQQNELKSAQVFIVDTIGILTKVYSYADVAYVGGGFTNGIHNILEPATFGVPIVIGPKYQKFKEAKDLVAINGCFVAHSSVEFDKILLQLRAAKNNKEMGQKASAYIKSNVGATNQILSYMIKFIKN